MPTGHRLPTHLDVEDKLLSIGSIDLTLRQCLILFIGGFIAFDVWGRVQGIGAELGGLAVYLRVVLAVIPLPLAFGIAKAKIEGRVFEDWLLIFLDYHLKPKLCTWRRIPQPSLVDKAIATYQKQQESGRAKMQKGAKRKALSPTHAALLDELRDEEGE